MSGAPIIQNLGPGNVFVGDGTVTTATGLKLGVGDVFEVSQDLGMGLGGVYLIADAASTDVRYLVVG